jgi:hypothetical protein
MRLRFISKPEVNKKKSIQIWIKPSLSRKTVPEAGNNQLEISELTHSQKIWPKILPPKSYLRIPEKRNILIIWPHIAP